MANLFHRFFQMLAASTTHDLRRQVQFLKAENQLLKSRVRGRVRTTAVERARLLRLGKPLGCALRDIITIVSPRTFAKWLSGERKNRCMRKERCPGRPQTSETIRRLVLRIARETDFGYLRIQGELKKLGYRVARTTVLNILRTHGVPTGPQRIEGTWDQFLRAHAKTLWACDFVAKRIWTARGLVQAFVLTFIHIQSRRVHVSASTTKPDESWVAGQAEAFAAATRGSPRPGLLLRDRDGKFTRGFDACLERAGIKPVRLPPRSPNLNAFAERFILTLKSECLDRFVVLGTGHLDHLVSELTDYYNRQRPHSRLSFRAPIHAGDHRTLDPPAVGAVRCQERLGGVLRHYYRRSG
ncbi:MAG: integrase core domain-containing protein [Phycisphaerales bacterium]